MNYYEGVSIGLKWMNRVVQSGNSTKWGVIMSGIKVVALPNLGTKIEFESLFSRLHYPELTRKHKIGIFLC